MDTYPGCCNYAQVEMDKGMAEAAHDAELYPLSLLLPPPTIPQLFVYCFAMHP